MQGRKLACQHATMSKSALLERPCPGWHCLSRPSIGQADLHWLLTLDIFNTFLRHLGHNSVLFACAGPYTLHVIPGVKALQNKF
jgi:short subunit dehydrogenase-like uncharacterized protein